MPRDTTTKCFIGGVFVRDITDDRFSICCVVHDRKFPGQDNTPML